eukprot:scaffold57416_cov60-Phaeocystis_antarctica.AAC.3
MLSDSSGGSARSSAAISEVAFEVERLKLLELRLAQVSQQRCHTLVANLVAIEVELLERLQPPQLRRERAQPLVADVVAAEFEHLELWQCTTAEDPGEGRSASRA